MSKPRDFKKITKELLQDYISKQYTLEQTAKELKVSIAAIRNRCSWFKISFKKPSKFNFTQYLQLKEKNLKEKEIASELNICGSWLNIAKKEHNIESRLKEKETLFLSSTKITEIKNLLEQGYSPEMIVNVLDDPNITAYYIDKHFKEYSNYKKRHRFKYSEFSKYFSNYTLIPKDFKLSEIQKQIIYGSLFGDNYCDAKGYLSLVMAI